LTEDEFCGICTSPKRDKSIICILEEASDVIAVEKTHEFYGLYHVLGGVLSPLAGITPDSLKIKELLKRFENEDINEVILALNADTEGETTALYLAKLIKPLNIKVSRIARGLPIGGDLEFADNATIGRALINRMIY
jgi:recombination protein RecR